MLQEMRLLAGLLRLVVEARRRFLYDQAKCH
jgi:hypothetical protein